MILTAFNANKQGLCNDCEGNYDFCLTYNSNICAKSQVDDYVENGGINEKSD